MTNKDHKKGTLADAINGADIFIGVSAPGIVTPEMVQTMAENAIVLPMANPDPEIDPELGYPSRRKGCRNGTVGLSQSD